MATALVDAAEVYLQTLFASFDEHCKLVEVLEFDSHNNFVASVRTKWPSSEEDQVQGNKKYSGWTRVLNKWVEKFSQQTNSKWIVRTSFSNRQRYIYRKIYICKSKPCKSRIDIRVTKPEKVHHYFHGGEIKVICCLLMFYMNNKWIDYCMIII